MDILLKFNSWILITVFFLFYKILQLPSRFYFSFYLCKCSKYFFKFKIHLCHPLWAQRLRTVTLIGWTSSWLKLAAILWNLTFWIHMVMKECIYGLIFNGQVFWSINAFMISYSLVWDSIFSSAFGIYFWALRTAAEECGQKAFLLQGTDMPSY